VHYVLAESAKHCICGQHEPVDLSEMTTYFLIVKRGGRKVSARVSTDPSPIHTSWKHGNMVSMNSEVAENILYLLIANRSSNIVSFVF
jgi:hypothetical protein